jgi:hypothetical protein
MAAKKSAKTKSLKKKVALKPIKTLTTLSDKHKDWLV